MKLKEGDRILLLGSSEEAENNSKIRLKKINIFFYKNLFDSTRFFELAKKKSSFDIVIDNCFSQYLHKKELPKFYLYLSRVLKFKGLLYQTVLSAEADICKKRCPKRKWTYLDKNYIRFTQRRELKDFIEANFRIDDFEEKAYGDDVYYKIKAVNDMKKF